ncbi:MAG: hypothetical protein KA059_03040 [Elusimicrobiales bacterium]|nr:hypothetical protein [Elusimicrobiales bacterium]
MKFKTKEELVKNFKINSNWDLIKFLFYMIMITKKWWLLPLLIVLGFLGIFVSISAKSSVLPAIYALF